MIIRGRLRELGAAFEAVGPWPCRRGCRRRDPEKPAKIHRNEYDAFRKALQEGGFWRDWADMNFESSTDQLQRKDQVRKVHADPGSPAKIRKTRGLPADPRADRGLPFNRIPTGRT